MNNKIERAKAYWSAYCWPPSVDPRAIGRFRTGLLNFGLGTENWKPRWLKAFFQSFDYFFKIDTLHYGKLTVSVSGKDPSHYAVLEEVLLENVYAIEAVDFDPDYILDLGANIGMFALIAGRRWPEAHLVCVEPHLETILRLAKNAALNGVAVECLQCAALSETKTVRLEGDCSTARFVSNADVGPTVLAIDVTALIPRYENLSVLIKIDVEGSEQCILESFEKYLPDRCFIFIELHYGDQSLNWIKKWGLTNNFVFTQIRRRDQAIDGFLRRIPQPF